VRHGRWLEDRQLSQWRARHAFSQGDHHLRRPRRLRLGRPRTPRPELVEFRRLPLLLSKKQPWLERDETVDWYIYKPAYDERWKDDAKSNRESARKIAGKGSSSYADFLGARAAEKGWKLKWMDDAADFWIGLKSTSDPISRVFYWGHAREDLWLSLDHQNHVACSPREGDKAIIKSNSIKANIILKSKFQGGDRSRVHRFIGCNTMTFARAWARVFGVFAEGVTGKVNFETIFTSSVGEPSLSQGASRTVYSPL
jgi:hypothetical protein